MSKIVWNSITKKIEEFRIKTEEEKIAQKLVYEKYKDVMKEKYPKKSEDEIKKIISKKGSHEINNLFNQIAGINSGSINEIIQLNAESVILKNKKEATKKKKYIENEALGRTYESMNIKSDFFDAVERLGPLYNNTDKIQSGSRLIDRTIDFDSLNYNFNGSKSSQTASRMLASKKFLDKSLNFMVYDLETLGGMDANGQRQVPIITEYAYSIYDKAGIKQSSNAIMPGLSPEQIKKVEGIIKLDSPLGSINTGRNRTNEEEVILNRLGLYGHKDTVIDTVKTGKMAGTSYIKSLVQVQESHTFSKDDYKRGIERLSKIYENQVNLPKNSDGLTVIEESIAEMLSHMNDDKMAIIDFNGTNADRTWINQDLAKMNFNGNESAKKAFMKKANIKSMNLDTSSERYLDLLPVVREARNKAGISGLFPQDALKNLDTKKSGSQEGLIKAFFKDKLAATGSAAHTAGVDSDMLAALITSKDGTGLNGETFINRVFRLGYDKNNIKNGRKIKSGGLNLFFANESTPWFENSNSPLSFTYDPFNESIRTVNQFSIGKNIEKDLVRENPIKKGLAYQFDWMRELDMSDEWIKEINNVHGNYAQKKMFAVKMSPHVDKSVSLSHQGTNGHSVMFFNSKDQAESYISSMIHIGTRDSIDDDFSFVKENEKEIKEAFSLNIIKDGKIIKTHSPESVNDIVTISTKSVINENAARMIRQNDYKKAANFSNLNKRLVSITGKENVTKVEASKILLDAIMSKDKEVSGKISNGQVLNDFKEALGWIDKNGNNKIITNTLDNAMASYDYMQSGDGIFKQIDEYFNKLNYSAEKRIERYPAIVENLVQQKIEEANLDAQSSKYMDKNTVPLSIYKKDMDYFDIDTRKIGDKKYKKMSITGNSSVDQDILRINLGSGKEYELIKKVASANNENLRRYNTKTKNKKEIILLKGFVKNLKNTNGLDSAFAHFDDTKMSEYKTSEHFANDIINSLRDARKESPELGYISNPQTQETAIASDIFKLIAEDKNTGDYIEKIDSNLPISIKAGKDEIKAHAKKIVDEILVDDINPHEYYKKLEISEEKINYAAKIYSRMKKEYSEHLASLIDTYGQNGLEIIYDKKTKTVSAVDSAKNILKLDLPKVRAVDGGLFMQIGGNKLAINASLDYKATEIFSHKNVNVITNMGAAFKSRKFFSKSPGLRDGESALDSLEHAISEANKVLRDSPDVSGNDAMDIQKIFELDYKQSMAIAHDMAKEGHLDNGNWKDSEFLERIKRDGFSYETSSSTERELFQKNIKEVIEKIAQLGGNSEDDTLLGLISNNLSFTNKDSGIADYVGTVGQMSHSNAIGFDATNRPPKNQTRYNSYRKADWDEKAGSNEFINKRLSTKLTVTGRSERAILGREFKGIGKTAAILEMNAANISEVGYKALVGNHYNSKSVLSERDKKVKKILMSGNLTEQEQIIDSRIADNFFNTTQMQKINSSKELSLLLDLNKDTIKKVKKLSNTNYKFTIDNGGNIVFEYGKGIVKKRHETLFEVTGFGDTVEQKLAKLDGSLNKGFFSMSNGIMATEKEINAIILNAKTVDEAKKIIKDTFEEKWYVKSNRSNQFFKMMQGNGSEKAMTRSLAAPLGMLDDKVKKYIEEYDSSLLGEVLSEDELKRVVNNYNENIGKKHELTKAKLEELIKREREEPSKVLFDDMLNKEKGISVISNLAEKSHGNLRNAFDKQAGLMKQHLINNGYSEEDAARKLFDDITNPNHKWLNVAGVEFDNGSILFPNKMSKNDFFNTKALDIILEKPEYSGMNEANAIKVNGKNIGNISRITLSDQKDNEFLSGLAASKIDGSKDSSYNSAYLNNTTGHKITDREMNMLDLKKYDQTMVDFMQDKLNKNDFEDTYGHILKKTQGEFEKNGDRYVISKNYDNVPVLKELTNSYKKHFMTSGEAFRNNEGLEKKLNEYYTDKNVKDGIRSLVRTGEEISKDAAELIYSTVQGKKAVDFNNAEEKSLKSIKANGFEVRKIEEMNSLSNGFGSADDVDSIFNKSLVLDAGEEFGEANRYTAIPYVQSKMHGDEIIREKFQKKISSVINAHNDLQSFNKGIYEGNENVTKEELIAKFTRSQEELKKQVSHFSISGKNGNMGQYYTRLDSSVSAKLSGIATILPGDFDNEAISDVYSAAVEKYGKNEAIQGMNYNALSSSFFNGKTILENHTEGKYVNALYGGDAIFEELGIIGKNSDKYLESTPFKTKEELLEHVEKNGVAVNAHRYPTIMTSSTAPAMLYYDKNLKGNQIKATMETVLAKNGDFDGDNFSVSVIKDFNKKDSIQSNNAGKIWKDVEADITYRAVGENAYYHKKAIETYASDIENVNTNNYHSVTQKATLSGNVLGSFDIIPSTEDIVKNNEIVNEFKKEYGNNFNITDEKDLKKVSSFIENIADDDVKNKYNEALGFEYQIKKADTDAMAKVRKNSIGEVNNPLHRLRQSLAASIGDSQHNEQRIINEAFYGIEQEVISAKKGNLYDYVTKTEELKNSIYKMTSGKQKTSREGEESFVSWLQKNMDFTEVSEKMNMLDVDNAVTNESVIETITQGIKNLNTVENKKLKSYFKSGSYNKEMDIGNAEALDYIPGTSNTFKDQSMNLAQNAGLLDAEVITQRETQNAYANKAKDRVEDILRGSENDESSGIIRREVKKATQSIIEQFGKTMSSKTGLLSVGLAAAYMITGYVGNNASKPADMQAEQVMQEHGDNKKGYSDYSGFSQNSAPSNNGYVINIKGSGSAQNITKSQKTLTSTLNNYMPADVNVKMNIIESDGNINDRYLDQLIIGAIGQ